MAVRIGTRLAGRYEIVAEIGRGGMGAVYDAHDAVLDRRVALKVVDFVEGSAFQHEAKLAAKLDHPAIVPVYDFGRDAEHVFFVMPIVDGLTLRQMLADGPLPQASAAAIMRQVAEALAHSHARGVVHRDIKPENIMVVSGGEGPRVKVLDFGIALEGAATPTRQIAGTPDYFSPEQARGDLVDARSDVYAIGAVIFECCAGRPPFVAEDVFALASQIVHAPAPRLRELVPEIDPEIDELVAACLEKDPRSRPESADRIAEALAAITARLRPVVLTNPSAPSSRIVVQSTLPASPKMVGRQSELARVRARLAAARRECQVIAIGGSWGIGKSQFVSVVAHVSQEFSMQVLRGRCIEDGDQPLHAFRDALVSFLRENPRADLGDAAGPLCALFPPLAELIDPPEAPKPKTRAETFELLARAIGRLATQAPVLLVLEDMQAAKGSVEAVRYLARRLAASPVALLLTHRTGDAPPDHPLFELRSALLVEPTFLDLELMPLERAPSDELVATLLPGGTIDPALGARLFAMTEGNPLHVHELTAELREAGRIKLQAGTWKLEGGVPTVPPLPASMRSGIERQLARLSDSERVVLEASSLFGNSFTYEDISALDMPLLDDALDRLTRRGLLRRAAGERWVFASRVVAEASKEALGPGRRRELEAIVAAHRASKGGPLLAGDAPREDAAAPSEMLGERLLVQGDYLAARELLDRANAHRPYDPSPEEAARHALKSALLAHRLGSFDEAELVIRGARQQLREGLVASELDGAMALVLCSRGRYASASELVERALASMGEPDARVRALLLRARGDSAMGLGRVADAMSAYDESGLLLDPLAFPLEHSTALFGSGDARVAAGKPEEARRYLERAERQKLAIGDRWGLARVHEGLARAALQKGRLDEALSQAQRAVLLASAIADPKLTSLARTRLAKGHLVRGEIDDAAAAVTLALRDARGCGAEPEIAAALVVAAEIQLEKGDVERAAETGHDAHTRASDVSLLAVALASLLVVIRAKNDAARLEEAKSIAERIGNPYLKLDVALAHAIVSRDEGAFEALVQSAAEIGAARHVGEALLQHARLCASRGDSDKATPLFLQASAVFAETGAARRAEEAIKLVE